MSGGAVSDRRCGGWLSHPRGADDVVGKRADRISDERQEDWSNDVVPAGAGHFSRTEEDGREEKFERHEGDVKNGGSDAGLDLLDGDIAEARAFQFTFEGTDFPK